MKRERERQRQDRDGERGGRERESERTREKRDRNGEGETVIALIIFQGMLGGFKEGRRVTGVCPGEGWESPYPTANPGESKISSSNTLESYLSPNTT